jgi:hypothetical protein
MNSEQLYELIKLQLNGDESFEAIERLVDNLCNQFNLDFSKEVLNRFRPQATEKSTPQLLVNWGELPQIGHRSCPEFNLLCPGYVGNPMISIRVDQDLDHDSKSQLHSPKQEQEGLWSFSVPFQLTTNQMDCRPGIYTIEIDVYFSHVPQGHSNFYRCMIRLNLKSVAMENGGILEIEGDGQSMVNLHGYDLKSFSKVVLKGGQDGVINLQNHFNQKADLSTKPEKQVAFEYALKSDLEKQKRLSTRYASNASSERTEKACLIHKDGRRTLLLSKKQIDFGRSRDNEIVLRFLPRSEENDNYSRYLSRKLMTMNLDGDGLELIDKSNSAAGIGLDYERINGRSYLTAKYQGHMTRQLEIGSIGLVSKPFSMKLHLYSMEKDEPLSERYLWHNLIANAVDSDLTSLHKNAVENAIDSVRLDRESNLEDRESYVLVFREALIGSSTLSAPIVMDTGIGRPSARILHLDNRFWIESLRPDSQFHIDDSPIAVKQLVPLAYGMNIRLGHETVIFSTFQQHYLD